MGNLFRWMAKAGSLFGNPNSAAPYDRVMARWSGVGWRLFSYECDNDWEIQRQLNAVEAFLRWDFSNDQNFVLWDEPFLIDTFQDPVVDHFAPRIPYNSVYSVNPDHPFGLHETTCKGFYAHYVRRARRWLRRLL